jgi:homospermidine synthase
MPRLSTMLGRFCCAFAAPLPLAVPVIMPFSQGSSGLPRAGSGATFSGRRTMSTCEIFKAAPTRKSMPSAARPALDQSEFAASAGHDSCHWHGSATGVESTRIDLRQAKIIFIGFGAVAKCVLNQMDAYLKYDPRYLHAVDQFQSAFAGPRSGNVCQHVLFVDETTFVPLLDSIGTMPGDVIIDLTYSSCTYHMIQVCLERGINYVNTSIEDVNDEMGGTSIDIQQRHVGRIVDAHRSAHHGKFRSNILTECGQNPGMIQHYVLHMLHSLHEKRHGVQLQTNLSKEDYQRVILDEKIGSILMSEIDDQTTTETFESSAVLINTWSVTGFLAESLDLTELVRGATNPFVKPFLSDDLLSASEMSAFAKCPSVVANPRADVNVLFLKESGINVRTATVAPVLTPHGIDYRQFDGKLIHHGEMFELARLLGEHAPFMSYVYSSNAYMDESVRYLHQNLGFRDWPQIKAYANQPANFRVLDQCSSGVKVTGQDSIGATLFCGTDSVERIYWCGSLFSDRDHDTAFTPTTLQVAAGLLSGLSYILEPSQQGVGWFQPCDLNTAYMIRKASPLLGRFFMTEVPVSSFPVKDWKIFVKKVAPHW